MAESNLREIKAIELKSTHRKHSLFNERDIKKLQSIYQKGTSLSWIKQESPEHDSFYQIMGGFKKNKIRESDGFFLNLDASLFSIIDALKRISRFVQKNDATFKMKISLLEMFLSKIELNRTTKHVQNPDILDTQVFNQVKNLVLLPTLEEALQICKIIPEKNVKLFLTRAYDTDQDKFYLIGKKRGEIIISSLGVSDIVPKPEMAELRDFDDVDENLTQGFNIIIVMCGELVTTENLL